MLFGLQAIRLETQAELYSRPFIQSLGTSWIEEDQYLRGAFLIPGTRSRAKCIYLFTGECEIFWLVVRLINKKLSFKR